MQREKECAINGEKFKEEIECKGEMVIFRCDENAIIGHAKDEHYGINSTVVHHMITWRDGAFQRAFEMAKSSCTLVTCDPWKTLPR